jgi:hypothetical protein
MNWFCKAQASAFEYASDEEAHEASKTQRGKPESFMVQLQMKHHLPAALNWLIEHVGDLAHRAQETRGIGMAGLFEKIGKIWNRLPTENIKRDIEEGIDIAAQFELVRSYPDLQELDDNVELREEKGITGRYQIFDMARERGGDRLEEIKERMRQEIKESLAEYAAVHREHTQPVTYLGELGKEAAVALGEMDFVRMSNVIYYIKTRLEEYSNAESEKREQIRLRKY